MSVYNRKGLTHSRKVITSSFRSSERSLLKETKRRLSETIFSDRASSLLLIRDGISPLGDLSREKYIPYGKSDDVWEVRKIPAVFVGISKPSIAVDKLFLKRRTEHENAVRSMKKELSASYAECEQEFRNRSICVKIQINYFRRKIQDARDKLSAKNLQDLNSKDFSMAWDEVSDLICEEKQTVDNFYKRLLIIEKKRQEQAKSILRKYYKIFHNVSFLLPYDIQVYLENEILNYNEAVLANHRIYADLRLQMRLLADAGKMRFKYWMEDLKINE